MQRYYVKEPIFPKSNWRTPESFGCQAMTTCTQANNWMPQIFNRAVLKSPSKIDIFADHTCLYSEVTKYIRRLYEDCTTRRAVTKRVESNPKHKSLGALGAKVTPPASTSDRAGSQLNQWERGDNNI